MKELKTKRSRLSFLKAVPIKFLLIAALFITAIFLFGLITNEVVFEKEVDFDNKIADFFATYSKGSFIDIMKFFTFFGSGKFLFPAYTVLVAFLLLKGKRVDGIHIALIGITSTLLSHGAKRIFQRTRPDLPLVQSLKTYSFPSGHALSSFIFCSVLAYLLWHTHIRALWKWILTILLFLFSVTIGISRIVLKMHYPTDVLAGFCLAFAWVTFSFYLLNHIKSKSPASA